MVGWECPTNPREASGLDPEAVHADWCGPCKQLEPIVEGVAANTSATVAKVDVDEHQALAGRYGVRGVPTMVLFSDGEAVEQVVGVRGEDQLSTLIESYT
ncbi:hypothetical protein GCM10008995_28410 [Halobellus salinus]|uniref:Thioredoxin domain-containing protein n=1 Tax=Halobellus salinus TaxID=931585 RepID=A0A830EWB3_9EURY|nr:hypothetical protein GCM10008995_28410 [Halobellus salinus]SMP31447.1 thioredoxin [Halobellus salinus]